MIELINLLKESGKIRFRQDFLDVIRMPKQHFRGIEAGQRHFSPEQIARACGEYGINANWVLGLEEKIWRKAMPVIAQKLPLTESPI